MPKAIQRVRRVVRLARRRPDGHKGDYGRVLVVGGSRGMVGAVALASQAALRAGAGLVTFAAPAPVQLAIATLCPCATSIPLECDASGDLGPGAVRQVLRSAEGCDVLAVGPGMAVGPGQGAIIRAVLGQEKPVVLDADGLNNLAAIDGWPEIRRCPLVLTPHPGEFSRLTGIKTAEIQADRIRAAVEAARDWSGATVLRGAEDRVVPQAGDRGARPSALRRAVGPLVLVLKGAGTVVTDGRRVYVNTTGNPGMATGGSGDVLTGVIAALIGQADSTGRGRRISPFDAACLGVHVHGLAGDLGAGKLGEVSLTAWDLLDFLPAAFRRLQTSRRA